MCLCNTEVIKGFFYCQPFSLRDNSSEDAVLVTDLVWIIQLF